MVIKTNKNRFKNITIFALLFFVLFVITLSLLFIFLRDNKKIILPEPIPKYNITDVSEETLLKNQEDNVV